MPMVIPMTVSELRILFLSNATGQSGGEPDSPNRLLKTIKMTFSDHRSW